MSIIMQIIIDSMLLLLSLLSISVNCESDHNFDLFIESNPADPFGNSGAGVPCEESGCTKIQFSLPDMKFWEVWKEDHKDVDRSDNMVTDSAHWPNPPAIWGESVMGQQSASSPPTRRPYSTNFEIKQPNGPIITKLDKIVDILRPKSDHQKDSWLDFGLKTVDRKPESRYDSNDNYYDYETQPTPDQYFNDKNIIKRNLKKFIIEDNDNKDVIIKKRQKKPTIYIEEELVPIEKPKKEVVYKIVKKPKPKPKTQHIIIEEEDDIEEPEEEEVEEEVVYQKKPTKKEKMKEIYILSNGEILSDRQHFIDQTMITTRPPTIPTTRAPTTTRMTTTTTTMKPIKRQKKRKTLVETEDKNELEDRNHSRDDDYYEEDYEEESEPHHTEEEDEEAWGSATPQTRVKPRSRKQSNLNPFSVLQRLRPPYRHPPPHPQPYPQPYPHPHPPPHQPVHSHGHKGGMVPGGTFRMRFYMDGPKYRESEDEPSSDDY